MLPLRLPTLRLFLPTLRLFLPTLRLFLPTLRLFIAIVVNALLFLPAHSSAVQSENIAQILQAAPPNYFPKGIDQAAKLLAEGDAAGALAVIDRTAASWRNPHYPERVAILRGLAFVALKEIPNAAAAFDQAIAASPSCSDALYLRATLTYTGEQISLAAPLLADAAWFNRFVLVPTRIAFRDLAAVLKATGKMGDALAAAEQAVKAGQRDEATTIMVGELYDANGISDQAITTLRGVISANPNSAQAKLSLARVLLRGTKRELNQNRIAEAAALAAESEHHSCCSRAAQPVLARALMEQGKFDASEEIILRGLRAEPPDPELTQLREQLAIERAASLTEAPTQ